MPCLTTSSASIIFVIVVFSVTCSFSQDKTLANPNPPNVLIITVDDLKDWVGYLDGYEGQVFTPNIDQLAGEGLAFTNAHTAATVCCPSRNAFMLGKRPSTTGLYNNGQWYKAVLPDEIALPQYFKMHGYYSAGAGKIFHHTPGNNPPCNWDEFQDQVFDDPWNFAEWSAERYFLNYGYRAPIVPYPDWKPLNGIYPIRPELDWGPIPGKEADAYGDTKAVQFAQDFLSRAHTQPFFLAVGIYRPHLPWHVPSKYYDRYPLSEIIVPEYRENDLADVPEAGKKLAAQGGEDFLQIRNENKLKEAVQAYLASITFTDDQVGAILESLAQSPYASSTIVVLWSDHGYHLGTKDHWHKQTLWEECTRIPFIMKVPGAAGNGSECSEPVDMTHVYPTLLSLCGLPKKGDLDGRDLSRLLEEPDSEWAYPAISEIGQGNVAIRSHNWRYIQYKDGSEELYNRDQDPNEWNNVASQEKYRAELDRHRNWVPEQFAPVLPGKTSFFFDPYHYTWLKKSSSKFIDGKRE